MACCACVYGYDEVCHKETTEKVVAVGIDFMLFHIAAAVATVISAVMLLIRLLVCIFHNYCSSEKPINLLPMTESRIEWLSLVPVLGPMVVAAVVYAKAREDGYGCLDSLVCAMQSPWMLLDSIRLNRKDQEFLTV